MRAALHRLLHMLRRLTGRSRAEAELDAEVRAYAELLSDERERAGLSPAAARRAALLETGGIEPVKEAVRAARPGILLETIAADIRYAARTLLRTPGFTLAAVLALALGIGANAAIFSVVNAVLLRPLPYDEPERLVTILHGADAPVGPANYLDWQAQSTSYAGMAAAEYWTPNLSGTAESEYLYALRITPNTMGLLGVRPLLGRDLNPRSGEEGLNTEALISHGLWQRAFGGDPSVVGRGVQLNGQSHTIVGVMPPDFRFAPYWATRAELWAPLALGERATSRNGRSLRVFARLNPGTDIERARAELGQITARLEQLYPGSNRDVRVHDLADKVVGEVRGALLVLFAAVGFVLLIACANVAHMLLARAAGRRREIALRAAIGATRGRLVRQLLTESMVLAGTGALLGLGIAWAGIEALAALNPATLPRLDGIRLDGTVLVFLVAVTLATGVAFGLAPALGAAAADLSDNLKDGVRGSAGGGRARLRSALVTTEIALALILLVGAGLMLRSFAGLRAIEPGFAAEGVVTMVVSATGAPSGEPGRRWPFYEQLIQQARALPGVRAAAAINHLPLAGDIWGRNFTIEGAPPPADPDDTPNGVWRQVTPGLFNALGIRLLRGRDIQDSDRLAQPGVVVVNERLARTFWPGEDPLGRRISLSGDTAWMTVVGVVADVRQGDWNSASGPEFYQPVMQNRTFMESPMIRGGGYLTLVVSTAGDAAALVPALRGLINGLDRAVTVSQILTTSDVVRAATATPRFSVMLLGWFASLALVLAAVGIYGTMSYTVAQRRLEFGIRMALGAGRGQVVRQVTGQALLLTAIGAAAGTLGALLLTRLMANMLYGVSATNPATFVAALLLLCCVALAAAAVPAVRASRVEPLRALRSE